MSRSNQEHEARIRSLANGFETSAAEVGTRYFVPEEKVQMARQLGAHFWLPTEHAYTIFLYAYTALFAIPSFTREALARHPDRFSKSRLAFTIRTTASFILDAFGYDPRMERPRADLYWPAPVIKRAHSEQGEKQRISNAAMAYFAFNLISASELLSKVGSDPKFGTWCEYQFEYVGEFLRTAGYPFPLTRGDAFDFATEVDAYLSDNQYEALWEGIPDAAEQLGVDLNVNHLQGFLMPGSANLFHSRRVD
jgi:hypothetical protein